MNGKRHDETELSAGAGNRAPIAPGPDTRVPGVASRRYMLLKGVTKGAAILAAGTPIKTLASTPSVTADGMICTLSGTQSGVHSASTGLPTCGGKSPGYYTKISHWPNYPTTSYTPTGCPSFSQNTTFNELFGANTTVGKDGLLHIMQTKPHSNAEFHWIAALLNAIAGTLPAGLTFPYSPKEVLNLYAGAQQADALAFFKGFMETL